MPGRQRRVSRLRAARDWAALTQTELAERAGVPKRQLQRYEALNHDEQPNVLVYKALAEALGLLIDDIVEHDWHLDVRHGRTA